MEDNKGIIIFLAMVVLVLFSVGGYFLFFRNSSLITPLPNESTIRVIFISPSPLPEFAAATIAPTDVVKTGSKAGPTTKPTLSVTKSPAVSPSAKPD